MYRLKISSAELAKICGVSQGTVDRALNNRPDIRKETKRKILEAAKLYGYRAPVKTETDKAFVGRIGIIIFNLNNEYFSNLVMEAEARLKEIGYCAIVMLTHYDKEREIECIRSMYNMGADGIILCAVNSGAVFENYLSLFDIPIVAVGNNIGGIPYVGIDDFAAMRDMTKNVRSDGYNRLIYYSPALKYADAYAQIERYMGFKAEADNNKAAKAAKIAKAPELPGAWIKRDGLKYTVVTDIEKLDDILNQEIPNRNLGIGGVAVICSTDLYALEVYIHIKSSDKSDLSDAVRITGFDNLKTIEKYKIPVDSVGYSVSDIASEAVSTIIENKRESTVLGHRVVKHKI